MSNPAEQLIIGLVSISDRASQGVYKDEGIPALEDWFKQAISAPQWRTVWHVVLPTARSGLTTSVILGVARGVLHKNTASRKLSRLTKAVSGL